MIELLIVIAIIALLAAMSVPNFLEAQIRAKVARVRNDMRALATALEAYYADFDSYPWNTAAWEESKPGEERERAWHGGLLYFKGLTTPVAYIGNVAAMARDPFSRWNWNGDARLAADSCYQFINRVAYNTYAPLPVEARPEGWDPEAKPLWMLVSVGPAIMPELHLPGAPYDDIRVFRTVTSPGAPALSWLAYDPTNGTVSAGALFRWGPKMD